jgi:hypothetical protein
MWVIDYKANLVTSVALLLLHDPSSIFTEASGQAE